MQISTEQGPPVPRRHRQPGVSDRCGSLWLALLLLVGCGERDDGSPLQVLKGHAMGTGWSLKHPGQADPDLAGVVADRLAELEAIFSTWDENSVVSRLNRGEEVELPDEYVGLSIFSAAMRDTSGGAFDVGVGDLVRRHGFGSPLGGRLDFSAVAKGFAVDEVAQLLVRNGVDTFLFELGGELIARGDREWKVGLESADPDSLGGVRRVIRLRDQAVATSGSYRQFRGEASHLIDPRTGRPVEHDCVSVSVVAATCQMADAYATAFIVMGIEDGMALAESEGLEAYFVRRLADGSLEELVTSKK